MSINIREKMLLERGYPIEICNETLVTGMKAPKGLLSTSHVGDTAAVYNMFGYCLSVLLKEKIVNAVICNDDEIYCEIKKSFGTKICMSFDGNVLSLNTEYKSEYAVFPIFFYILSNLMDTKECKDIFEAIVKQYNTSKSISASTIALFCDAMYYEPFSEHLNQTIIVQETVNIEESFVQSQRKGAIKPIDLLQNIQGLPLLYELNNSDKEDSSEKKDDLFEKAKVGELRLNYDFKHKEAIPSLNYLDKIVPTKKFLSILNKVVYRTNKILKRMESGLEGLEAIQDDYLNIIMVGDPGTGKTVLAHAIAAATGMPIMFVNGSEHTEEGAFEGDSKMVQGVITSIQSDYDKIHSDGGIFVLEEGNIIKPGVVMGAIGQAIEFPFILKRDGYESVQRHPLCIVIMTMNTGTAGTKEVNDALSSRFNSPYIFDSLTNKDAVNVLTKKGFDRKSAKKVYDVFLKIKSYLCSPEINNPEAGLNLTLRACVGALQSMEEGESFKDAVHNCLVGKIAEKDKILADEIYNKLIKVIV